MILAFKTFGCRLNRAEALDQEAAFRAAGHTIVDLPTGTVPNSLMGTVPDSLMGTVPDGIIVRGCSVTARAQRDCEKEIARLQARFPRARIFVQGCLPGVPLGNENIKKLLKQQPISPISDRTSRAYLKVQDGCNERCAFCIVPQFRGPPRSVPFNEVLDRARAFLAAGFRELVVTGCNLALYRSDGHGLPDLLAALATMGTVPAHRVRLGSLEPGICDEKILDVFEKHRNICRFIHLSLQSGSPHILARMNRPYTIETVADFCREARRRLGPRLTLGADVIAGFPGEAEDDFNLTKSFIRGTVPFGNRGTVPFGNLHVFPYSERPGTPAATMDGALPRAIRLARARELEGLGRAARLAFAQSFLGQTVEVCVERGGDHGWTAEYLPCRIKGAPAERRSLISLHVVAVTESGDLVGERLRPADA